MNTDGHLNPDEAKALVRPASAPPSLSPTERLAISDHLAACVECRSLVAAARVPLEQGKHLVLEEARSLTEAAQTEATQERDDLQAFMQRVASYPAERFEPGSTLPPSLPPGRASSRRNGAAKSTTWWTPFLSRPMVMTIGFAAAALVAVLGVTTFFQRATPARPSPKLLAREQPLLRDGSVVVAADGSLQTSADFPADLRVAILETIRQGTLRLSASNLGAMRGDAGEPAPSAKLPDLPPCPVTPSPGSTIESQRPELQWTGVPGATGYQVQMSSPSTGDQPLSPTLPSFQTRWQPETSLERGRIYHWTVLVHSASGQGVAPTKSASLKVLSTRDEETLVRLRAMPEVSHLALAVACARLNLAVEARQELEILAAAHPESTFAAHLRASSE